MSRGRVRRIFGAVCGTLGVLLVVASLLLGYLTRSLFNEKAFSVRVASSLEDPRFASYVAEQLADAVIRAKPDLVGVRPVIIGVGRSVVSSAPFRAAVRRSARIAHHAIMTGTGREIVLDVKDVGVMFEGLAESQPGIAKKIPPSVTAAMGKLSALPAGERMVWLIRLANRMRAATFTLFAAGVLLCVASVWLSRERRRAIIRLGIALAAFAIVLGLVSQFGGDVASRFARNPEYSPAVAALFGAFLRGLLTWAIGLGFAGLVLAAASASLLERVPILRWWGQGVQWLFGEQPKMRYRLARGMLGALVGGAILLWPMRALSVFVFLGGMVVSFLGLREAFYAALHLLPQPEATMARVAVAGRTPRGRAIALVGSLAIALLAGAGWFIFRADATSSSEHVITACNGSALLCDKPLDQVVFPTTHNSMSGANIDGWMFPNQTDDIEHQLKAGIRGFLIDALYAQPHGDRVKTELSDSTGSMAKYETAMGSEALEAALRIRERMQKEPTGDRDVYMCHGLCELGAVKLVPVLRDMKDFLVANPGEILIIVIQDEGVTPQDIERCFTESGLIDFVYRGAAKPPWPTLRQMAESDQRVLVMAENSSEGVDWYHSAFEVMQETPYTFHTPEEFSNKANRGGTSGSLLLMNHWIETTPMPKPSNAAIVNAHDVLLARIKALRKQRGRLPNLVAVDFYGTGDLLQVVRELNETPLATTASRPRR